jgi:hypothetical protein
MGRPLFRQFVIQEYLSYLFHLIRLGFSIALRLQIDDLFNSIPRENVMITSHATIETISLQDQTQIFESNVRIGPAIENFLQHLRVLAHGRLHIAANGSSSKKSSTHAHCLQSAG